LAWLAKKKSSGRRFRPTALHLLSYAREEVGTTRHSVIRCTCALDDALPSYLEVVATAFQANGSAQKILAVGVREDQRREMLSVPFAIEEALVTRKTRAKRNEQQRTSAILRGVRRLKRRLTRNLG
jgi:hypothetical protein